MLLRHRPTVRFTRAASLVLVAVLGIGGLAACEPAPPVPVLLAASDTSTTVPAGQRAANSALSQVGARYVWGGSSPASGFDCSGLTSWAWKQAGTTIARTSRDQYAATTRIKPTDLQPGDLVFYAADGVTISHVAMYVGDDRIVHARNTTTGVLMSQLSTYWTSQRVGYGRVQPTTP
jgi:cell wall-associated NlpC family hydrolase